MDVTDNDMTAPAEVGGNFAGPDDSVGFEVAEATLVEEPPESVKHLFGEVFPEVNHFAQILRDEGEVRGLIGPRELPRLWSRHLVNSAAVLDFIPAQVAVVDIGSGAGFPGIVIAICRSDLEVHLVEPMRRRFEWLCDVADEIGLDNVSIHNARAEELRGQGMADVVTARAVANLKKLLPLAMPLIVPGGRLLALKGRRAYEEVKDARPVFALHSVDSVRVHEVPSPMEDESTMVVELMRARDQRAGRRGQQSRGRKRTNF